MFSSGGTNAQVNCNVISNMGRCMQFNNTSINKVAKNVMNGTYQGLVLSNSGIIGPQGNALLTNDNEWNGFTGGAAQYAETYTELTSNANTGSILFVKPGSPYEPTQHYSSNGNPYSNAPGLGIRAQTLSTPGETCLALRMLSGDDNSNTDNGNNAMRVASNLDTLNVTIFEAMASDTTFYDVYQNEMQYRNKQLVYELINSQSIDTTKFLNEFYSSNQNNSYQDFININNAIGSADYVTAQSFNNSINTNNTIEAYQKRINELLLKYLSYQPQVDKTSSLIPVLHTNNVFNEDEIAEIKTIANDCLDKYGNVITQARILVNNISNTLVEFENNCKLDYNQRKAKTENQAIESSKIKTVLYPNPNNGNMVLEYDLGAETNAKIHIFDINGRLINSYKLTQIIGKLDINSVALTNGVYYYSILINEKLYSTNKIIVIK